MHVKPNRLTGGEKLEDSESPDDLRKWVVDNLTTDPANILWDERERAAKFFTLAPDGSVVMRPNEKYTARHKVLVVHVGKLYAEAAGYVPAAVVTYPDLLTTLNLPEGTVYPAVKGLRDDHVIDSVDNGRHVLTRAKLTRALEELENL